MGLFGNIAGKIAAAKEERERKRREFFEADVPKIMFTSVDTGIELKPFEFSLIPIVVKPTKSFELGTMFAYGATYDTFKNELTKVARKVKDPECKRVVQLALDGFKPYEIEGCDLKSLLEISVSFPFDDYKNDKGKVLSSDIDQDDDIINIEGELSPMQCENITVCASLNRRGRFNELTIEYQKEMEDADDFATISILDRGKGGYEVEYKYETCKYDI